MKKIQLLFLLLFSSTFFLNAQDCKPAGNSKNKDTGVKTPFYGGGLSDRIRSQKVEYNPYLYVVNDPNEKINYIQTVLNISHMPTGIFNNRNNLKMFDTGTTFELILENDERLLFRSTQAGLNHKFKTSYSAYQSAPLSDENLEKLTLSKVKTFVIYPFSDTEIAVFTYDLRGKKGEKLLHQFTCFKSVGYDNTGKVKNARKAETYLKLADKYIKAGQYDKALEYYSKSDEEYPNAFSKANLCILNVFLQNDVSNNVTNLKKHLDSTRRSEGSEENLGLLETLTLNLIEANPEIVELEEILLMIAE